MAFRMRTARRRATRVLVALTGAALLAVLTSPTAASAAVRTITGRVDDAGTGLVGVAVGYTDPDTGVVARSRTTADGRFTIRLPDSPGTGFVWAGLEPRLAHVTFTAHHHAYVRAVIGLVRPRSAPGALFETLRAAAPGRIAGGGAVAVHLRRAARLGGRAAALAGFRIDLRRGDGTLVQSVHASRTGAYRATPLAAGRYDLTLLPPGAVSPGPAHSIVLRSGRTTAVPIASAKAATKRVDTVTGLVTTPKGVSHAGIRIEALRGGRVVTTVRTSATGRYRIRGLTPGAWTILAGRNAPFFDDFPSPAHPTPDAIVATSRTVHVAPGRTVHLGLPIRAAAHVTGSTTKGAAVVVEDSAGLVVRRAVATASGRFDAGGLPGGTFTVIASTSTGYVSRTAQVAAGSTTDLGTVDPTASLLSITGAVGGRAVSKPGDVQIEAQLQGGAVGYDTAAAAQPGTGVVGTDGRYTVGHAIPGRYSLDVDVLNGEDLPPTTAVLASAPITVDLTAGPDYTRYSGSFRTLGGPGLWYLPYSVTSTAGAVSGLSGLPAAGTFRIQGVAGGTYRWEPSTPGIAIASDGPWWSFPAEAAFTIPAGGVQDVRIPIRIHH